ncbi:MAG: fumarylacetoacetate hydrolase family protein [Anaerolineae bacterium]|nr:fumarylacetoacetate hydrolase family protein [Anaerolineae bacterium]
MRFIRFTHASAEPRFGWILGDQVGLIDGDLFGADYRRLETSLSLDEVKLLAPLKPGKIIAVGRNYADHAKEQNAEVPSYPLLFLKAPSSIIAPGETILIPPQSERVDHEAELAVVIGKRGRWITLENAMQHVFGYTIANDITARDLQNKDGQWTRAKGFDTFCPLGPWIETELDPADVLLSCRVNGQMRQMSSTREMVFSVAQLIVFISSIMTLEPGDLILTGTPSGISPLKPGDQLETEIEGIGLLKNPVKLDGHH